LPDPGAAGPRYGGTDTNTVLEELS
jgi:hypothetical protein